MSKTGRLPGVDIDRKKVKMGMLALDLSAAGLAEKIGRSAFQIRCVLAGSRKPSIQTAELMANALGLSVEYILLGGDE